MAKFEPKRLTNDGGKTFRTARTATEETKLRYDGYRSAPAEKRAAETSSAPKPSQPQK